MKDRFMDLVEANRQREHERTKKNRIVVVILAAIGALTYAKTRPKTTVVFEDPS